MLINFKHLFDSDLDAHQVFKYLQPFYKKKPSLSEGGFYRSLSFYPEFLLSIFVTLKMLLALI